MESKDKDNNNPTNYLEIREDVHSGTWYTSQKNELDNQINCWLEMAKNEIKPTPKTIKALIVPHSGFAFSGFTAAWAYKHIKPIENLRVFILGPCHFLYLRHCGLPCLKNYKTPLCDIEVDVDTIKELHKEMYFESVDKDADEEEHSIELQLPFLAKILNTTKFKIVPILVGSLELKLEKEYGAVLSKYLEDKNNLFIISTDLIHWGAKWNYTYFNKDDGEIFESIEKIDRKFMDIVETQNPNNIAKFFEEYEAPICGKQAISIFMNAVMNCTFSRFLNTKFVRYSQSFPIKDKKDSSISFGSAPKPPPKTKKQLRLEEQTRKREEEKTRQDQEKKRLAEEEEKKKEFERLKKIEDEKLAKEEFERLVEENKNEVEIRIRSVNANSSLAEKKVKENEDWDKFICCNIKPDVSKESDLTTFETEYKDQKKINNEKEITNEIMSKAQQCEEIIKDLYEVYMKAKSDSKYDKETWCLNYIKSFREITSRKFDEITSFLTINSDILLEENQIRLEKEKKENQSKSMKQDSNQKQELLKLYSEFKDFRYGLWINPNSKSGYRHKPVDFSSLGIQCEVPRTLMSGHLIMKVLWTSYDYLSSPEIYSKDMVVGGVLDIECFEFLPQPKKANNWTLKYDYETKDSLKKHNYPVIDQSGVANYQNVSPVKVFYTLPNYVFINANDKIRVAVWDKNAGWVSENIDEIKYDPDKKLLSFATLRLAPLAYIQERCIDYPYLSWKLRCINDDTALLDIQGKRQIVRFEIGSGYVSLRYRNEPELSHLELCKCGINLLPVEKDASTANINYKNPEAESLALQDVCFAVRSFFIKSSRWNHIINSEKIMLRMRENLEYDEEFAEDQEKDWKTLVWWKNKVACIKMRDSYENLTEDLKEGTCTHARLDLLLSKHELTQTEAIDRMKDTQYIIFNDTLKRFLKLTKLLSFTFE